MKKYNIKELQKKLERCKDMPLSEINLDDIDTHLIPLNDRVNMTEHYHFDFRYLFFINGLSDIILDEEECKDYKWMSSDKLNKDKNYGNIINKFKKIIDRK